MGDSRDGLDGGWVKTTQGWKQRISVGLDVAEITIRDTRTNTIRPSQISNNREISNARSVIVYGSQKQRRLSVCLSEFIDHLDLSGAVSDLRRHAYLHEVMLLLMGSHIHKVSGSALRQLFKILEAMVNEAISRELNIQKMKHMLLVTLQTIETRAQGVGCVSLWKRFTCTVANLQIKLNNFTYTEPSDGSCTLTDLPKECIYDIMHRLTDHRDLLNLGATCTDLYDMSQDGSLWESLCQYHFTEKQTLTFIQDIDELSEFSQWRQLYQKCFRKYGRREMFADQLVVCSGCRSLHWLMRGHKCWRSAEDYSVPYMDPVSPTKELPAMLNM